jgi:DHA1 family tetracycline resistance protein-like MFS transporter
MNNTNKNQTGCVPGRRPMNDRAFDDTQPPGDAQRRLAVLFAVVFVDMLGFGILLPLIPFYGVRLGLSADWLTLVISLHALFQFIGAPILGRLSDRHGRRPILLLSMAGHAFAYMLLAFADSIVLLAASRIISGFTSGNLSAAYAYASDLSRPAERSATLARISAAFALGLTFGPLLGALLTGRVDPAAANLHAPALASGVLSLLSCVSILWLLPESPRHAAGRREVAAGLRQPHAATIEQPAFVRWALCLSMLVIVFSAVRETLFALWMHDKFDFDTFTIGAVIAAHGLMVAAVQLFGAGRLAAGIGERRLVLVGIAAYACSWLGLSLSSGVVTVILAMTFSALATAVFATSLQSLLTQAVSDAERGGVLGALQSSSALARFVGAAISGTLYAALGPDAPFFIGALAMLPALWMGRSLRRQLSLAGVAR